MNWITTIDYYWPTQICKSSPICTNLPIVPQKNCQNLKVLRQFKLIQFVIFNFNNHYSTSSMEADIYGELVQIRGGGRKKYQRSWSKSGLDQSHKQQQHAKHIKRTTTHCIKCMNHSCMSFWRWKNLFKCLLLNLTWSEIASKMTSIPPTPTSTLHCLGPDVKDVHVHVDGD